MDEKPRTTPYPLRMPDDLRTKLEASAKSGARSLHAEIVARLESTFCHTHMSEDLTFKMLNAEIARLSSELHQLRSEASPLMAGIGDTVEGLTHQAMEATGLNFDEALLLIATRGAALETQAPIAVVQVAKDATLAETRAIMNAINDELPADASVYYEPFTVPATRLISSQADKQAMLDKKNPK